MTRFLDVGAASQLIRDTGLELVLTELAAAIESDYRRWNEFEKAPRVVRHSPVGVNELMPTSDKTLFAFKYVNGHPGNTAKGLMTVVAFGMLADIETGYPMLLSEMTLVTALRTAATSAVAGRAMARKNSKSMAVIGCGAQSEFQILAFKALLNIRDFRVFDIDPAAIAKLQRNLSGYEGITVTAAPSAKDAVKGADIVTTATAAKTKQAVLTRDMIEDGMHINGIGGDCQGKTELHPDVLKAARVVVEFEPQTREEGDIQQMPADFPVTELWKILTGAETGRQSDNQITLFDSVGFALEDFSALRYLHALAGRKKAGIDINLVPTLGDFKDLYSLLHARN